MPFCVFASARTPTQPVISAAGFSASVIQITLITPSSEPSTGIAFYRLYRAIGTGSFAPVAQLQQTQFPYNDPGLTIGTAYSYYIVAVNNAPNADSSAPSMVSSASTIQPITPSNQVKWNPAIYVMSLNFDSSSNNPEMNLIAPAVIANPSIFGGYCSLNIWTDCETSVLGVYDFSTFEANFNYWQTVAPGFRFAAAFAAYANWMSTFSGSAGGNILPAYIYNNPSTYGLAAQGSSQGGWGFSTYEGNSGTTNGKYGYTNAALWNAAVMARWTAFFTAFGQHSFQTTAGPYKGQTFTVDTHPLMEAVFDWGPTDLNMLTADGKGPNPTTPTDYSGQAWGNQWLARCPGMSAAFPHTNTMLMPGYGGTGQIITDQGALVAQMAANRVGVSCTDVFWEPGADLTYGQHQFIGDKFLGYDTNNNPIWGTGQGTDYRGSTPSMPTVQGYDYMHRTSIPGTSAQVQGILSIAYNTLKASHVFTQIGYSSLSDWTNYVLPGILAAGGIPSGNKTVPLNYQS